MDELKQKLATAVKLDLKGKSAFSVQKQISFRNTSIGFSCALLKSIGVSTTDKSGVNVYINRKYNVLIFEFIKDIKQGVLTLQPKIGISCTAVYKLLQSNGYPVPRGRFTHISIHQDLDTGLSYVEFALTEVVK